MQRFICMFCCIVIALTIHSDAAKQEEGGIVETLKHMFTRSKDSKEPSEATVITHAPSGKLLTKEIPQHGHNDHHSGSASDETLIVPSGDITIIKKESSEELHDRDISQHSDHNGPQIFEEFAVKEHHGHDHIHNEHCQHGQNDHHSGSASDETLIVPSGDITIIKKESSEELQDRDISHHSDHNGPHIFEEFAVKEHHDHDHIHNEHCQHGQNDHHSGSASDETLIVPSGDITIIKKESSEELQDRDISLSNLNFNDHNGPHIFEGVAVKEHHDHDHIHNEHCQHGQNDHYSGSASDETLIVPSGDITIIKKESSEELQDRDISPHGLHQRSHYHDGLGNRPDKYNDYGHNFGNFEVRNDLYPERHSSEEYGEARIPVYSNDNLNYSDHTGPHFFEGVAVKEHHDHDHLHDEHCQHGQTDGDYSGSESNETIIVPSGDITIIKKESSDELHDSNILPHGPHQRSHYHDGLLGPRPDHSYNGQYGQTDGDYSGSESDETEKTLIIPSGEVTIIKKGSPEERRDGDIPYSTHGFNGVRGDQNYGSGSSEAHIPVYSNGHVYEGANTHKVIENYRHEGLVGHHGSLAHKSNDWE
ncbi:uncharacterized protein LOC126837084 isoform X7 [Adelges cooleyi]|uniref:uncharacterized protein LOC126837084 isoform X5 n=1 Tax=Adelges cooleyi TaxID=133065 RepID=UPI00217F963D|nr:uncharacterized protein LOC126837084 isoform X5 [Adelges cooleyi]XP_050426811.1 uncharacterized protein LOC126837084 isoform X6 [Adelges cooleyi]XP_050426812.1 uncharacterized protein LOC126837084 isoform X7 [Adelges cooleyi]